MILAGATAVVTGGAVRIGRAIALHLAGQGMNVAIHYGSSEDAAASTVTDLKSLGVRAMAISGDLRHPVLTASHVFQQVNEILGPALVLVNNAAIFETGSLLDTDEENWERHLSINLKAPFFLTQEFVKQLPKETHAAVINVADWRGESPVPGHAAYTMAKAGLIAQTKLLAQELGPQVRVNAIAPGAILPPPGATGDAFARRGDNNPLRKVGTPDDITRAVQYLLTAPFVTGEILHVTGGEQL